MTNSRKKKAQVRSGTKELVKEGKYRVYEISDKEGTRLVEETFEERWKEEEEYDDSPVKGFVK